MRMGANMARRLKDSGYEVSAVYDIRSEAAIDPGTTVGTLAQVTKLSDVIITVVIDDASSTIFAGEGDSLLTGAGDACSSTVPHQPGRPRGGRGLGQGGRRGVSRGLHGLQHHQPTKHTT